MNLINMCFKPVKLPFFFRYLLLFLVVVPCLAYGQIEFRLNSGLALSKLTVSADDVEMGDAKYLPLHESGIIIRYYYFKTLYAQIEVNYIAKGGDIDVQKSDDETLKIKSNQLEAPILVGVKSNFSDWNFYINGGGYYGRMLNTEVIENPFDGNHKFYFDKKDYGYLVGIGLEKKIAKTMFFFDVKYRNSFSRFGLVRFLSPTNSPIGHFVIDENREYSFLLGVIFKIN